MAAMKSQSSTENEFLSGSIEICFNLITIQYHNLPSHNMALSYLGALFLMKNLDGIVQLKSFPYKTN